MITRAGREAWRTMLGILYLRVRARVEEAADTVGVSPGALRALSILEPGGGRPMRELAERWGCDASYITSLADDLEGQGLARREPHPTDRRVKMLVLTDAGLALREQAHALLTEPPDALDALTAEEQRTLRDLLKKIGAGEGEVPFALAPARPAR